MCGIVGAFRRSSITDAVVKEMADAIRHRGPNSQTQYASKDLKLVFNRLAILDQTTAAEQPQCSGNWRVWLNGCIYNYQELKRFFPPSIWKTTGDTEVLAALIERFGFESAIPMLNGMFVIVAHNCKTSETFIARDRYGIKPLYYGRYEDQLVFASEIKALLKLPGYQARPDPEGIAQWMSFQNIYNDATLFLGIRKMEKGTIWNLVTGHKTKYWKWDFKPNEQMDYWDAVAEVRDLFIKAVDRQSISDMPISAWCSGGVDSSAIASVAKCRVFNCSFSELEYDETKYARMISDKHRLAHYSSFIDHETLRSVIFRTIESLEDLRVGPSYSNYYLYALTSKFSRVCLQGTGADELFGGYTWRYDTKDYEQVANRTGIPYTGDQFDFSCYPESIYERYDFDAETFLEGVLLVGDKLSMAHSIEDRVPFLDNDLVDFAQTIPAKFKFEKQILKDALKGIVPDEILTRKKKGFTSPEAVWFYRKENRAWILETIKASKQLPKYVQIDAIQLFDQKNTPAIWSLLALAIWFQVFIEK